MLLKYFMLFNGINTRTGDLKSWHFRAEDFIENTPPYWQAGTYHYFVTALFRWLRQKFHIAQALIKVSRRSRPEEKIILVGHSNGCDIIVGIIKKLLDVKKHQKPEETQAQSELKIAEIHLVAPATEHDFEKNGLNEAVKCGIVGKIFVYISPDDQWLRIAKWTKWISYVYAGWGYGFLGLVGPKNVAPETKSVLTEYKFAGFRHNTYFSDKYFERVMKLTMGDPNASEIYFSILSDLDRMRNRSISD
jgi:hypothetical protein